jgi:hypothetical protein
MAYFRAWGRDISAISAEFHPLIGFFLAPGDGLGRPFQ